jgi:hypothetical protein
VISSVPRWRPGASAPAAPARPTRLRRLQGLQGRGAGQCRKGGPDSGHRQIACGVAVCWAWATAPQSVLSVDAQDLQAAARNTRLDITAAGHHRDRVCCARPAPGLLAPSVLGGLAQPVLRRRPGGVGRVRAGAGAPVPPPGPPRPGWPPGAPPDGRAAGPTQWGPGWLRAGCARRRAAVLAQPEGVEHGQPVGLRQEPGAHAAGSATRHVAALQGHRVLTLLRWMTARTLNTLAVLVEDGQAGRRRLVDRGWQGASLPQLHRQRSGAWAQGGQGRQAARRPLAT